MEMTATRVTSAHTIGTSDTLECFLKQNKIFFMGTVGNMEKNYQL